ncbi:gamma-D-glutamyl-L-lysine endopeptidase [Moorella mulderi DSM 14980]|uniref:Gamma-D-glutamyl-L-lysine endopeptidase n=2 Tax=Neomoorella TaxID=44260 RepID=A0A151AQ07_9FIRM|nr:gamma-D-glutamyl-L-lysine endopeptidase [Moorella mulderi DSM 14980]
MTHRAVRLPPRVEEPPGPVPARRNAYYVRVAVADVRANPGQGAELVTQALLGDELKVLKQEGDWLQGQVPDGYIGWVKTADVVPDTPPADRDLAAVTVPRAILYLQPGGGNAIGEALMATDLPLLQQKEGWMEVWLPGRGTAWLAANEVEVWPGGKVKGKRSGEDVIKTAERLRGVSYLWGGVSLYGIDCSGLAYIAYYLNGVQLPRDADMQFQVGREVARADLQPGDLVFFNTESSGSLPTHVGIYTGNGEFINSRSGQGVITSRLDEPLFAMGYLGARRYLP